MKFTDGFPVYNTVRLDTLKVGDTFMYNNRIGMLASRNGHDFPLDLATGTEFYHKQPERPRMPHNRPAMLDPSALVIRVDAELIYKIRG